MHDRTSTRQSSRRRAGPIAGLLAPVLLLALPAPAPGQQERPREQRVPEQDAPAVVSLQETAANLARAGSQTRDPVSLLAAAQLLLLLEEGQRGTADRVAASGGEPTAAPGDSAEALLRRAVDVALDVGDPGSIARAAALAGDPDLGAGNEALRAAILEELRGRPAARGAVGGPVRREGRLADGDTAVYRLRFEGGDLPNGIYVQATNPFADLDCAARSGGKELMVDVAPESGCFLAWKQPGATELILEIRHAGEPTYFVLVSN